MSNKQILLFAFAAFAVMGIIATTVALTRERQENRSSAQTGSCTAPATVQNVQLTYPYCDQNNDCSLTQAQCTWSAVTGATGYQLTITQVESNTIVRNEVVTSTSNVFNVTQGQTYKCDVAAINACGDTGQVASDELLCQVDAALTITPTPIASQPTFTPVPTLPPGITPISFTSTPPPTLPPAGVVQNSVIVGGVAAALILVGGLFFIF